MESVILVIHLFVALAIIAVVMLQRSEGGGLGIGGGGMGNFAGQRSTTDFMTRLTTALGAIFVVTSLTLAIMAGYKTENVKGSILDIKASDMSAIQDALDADVTADDAINAVKEAPKDGAIAVPPAPIKTIEGETSEKPTAPVSK